MDVFELRETVVVEYSAYIKSFLRIDDAQIDDFVHAELARGHLWPDPLVHLNPAFEPGETVAALAQRGVLHAECARIFRRDKDENGFGPSIRLHHHQQEAIAAAERGGSYVLTTGTGSGKSLAYFIPIVDDVLRQGPRGARRGIAAIVVYPMNALCNSQMGELEKFLRRGYGPGQEPVTFARYTGQETEEERKAIADRPPDILLTNYVMLELLLTRMDPNDERVIAAAEGLRFLVLDELHTYRGRQGADVAMLVRRVRERCGAPTLRCIGTSATMAGSGTREDRAAEVSAIASRLFGDHVAPENVIGETLRRAITRPAPTTAALRAALSGPPDYAADYAVLSAHPLAAWAEMAFGLAADDRGRLERSSPVTMAATTRALAEETGVDVAVCRQHLQAILLAGYATTNPATGFPLFAFRLHQFISRGDAVYGSIEPPETRALTMEGQVYVPGDRSRRLYPLAFCRECGAPYYVVDRPATGPLLPRTLNAVSDDPQVVSGFLLLDADERDALDPERLPEDWLETRADGTLRARAGARGWLPQPLSVTPDGVCTADAGLGALHALFLPAPFRYCPCCDVTYSAAQRSDFGKLAMLSTEGRSTATTILSLTVVQALRGTAGHLGCALGWTEQQSVVPADVPGWRGGTYARTPLEAWVYPVMPGQTAADTPALAALIDWVSDWIRRQEAQDGCAGHAMRDDGQDGPPARLAEQARPGLAWCTRLLCGPSAGSRTGQGSAARYVQRRVAHHPPHTAVRRQTLPRPVLPPPHHRAAGQ
jgi:hypothetical protein